MTTTNATKTDPSVWESLIGRFARSILPARWAGRLIGPETANQPDFEEGTMLIECQAVDPAVHDLSVRIAIRCTQIIKPPLRRGELHEALTEFYRSARLEIEKREPIGEL